MVLKCAKWEWMGCCPWNGTPIPLWNGAPAGTREVTWLFFLDQSLPPSVANWADSPCTRLNQLQFVQLTDRSWMMWTALSLLFSLPPQNVFNVQMSAQIKNLGNTPAKTACSWDYKDYKCVQRVPKISGLVLCKHTGLLLPFYFYFWTFRKKMRLHNHYFHCLCCWGSVTM